jgi:nitrogen fixation NifU-like protein
MYSPQVLDHFEHPRNVGEVDRATAVAQLENPICGDSLRMSVRFVDGRIPEIKFKAKGCVTSVACASALTEMVLGKDLDEVRSVTREELVQTLGGLSPETMHASHLAMDTLQELLKQIR